MFQRSHISGVAAHAQYVPREQEAGVCAAFGIAVGQSCHVDMEVKYQGERMGVC